MTTRKNSRELLPENTVPTPSSNLLALMLYLILLTSLDSPSTELLQKHFLLLTQGLQTLLLRNFSGRRHRLSASWRK